MTGYICTLSVIKGKWTTRILLCSVPCTFDLKVLNDKQFIRDRLFPILSSIDWPHFVNVCLIIPCSDLRRQSSRFKVIFNGSRGMMLQTYSVCLTLARWTWSVTKLKLSWLERFSFLFYHFHMPFSCPSHSRILILSTFKNSFKLQNTKHGSTYVAAESLYCLHNWKG